MNRLTWIANFLKLYILARKAASPGFIPAQHRSFDLHSDAVCQRSESLRDPSGLSIFFSEGMLGFHSLVSLLH